MRQGIPARRNTGLDFLKYLCAFFVICIHMPYPGEIYLEPVTRTAVPVFFMVTGYFYASVCQSGKAAAQIRKVAKLLLWAYLLYFLWDMWILLVAGQSFLAYLRTFLNPLHWVKFLVFNASLFSGHLWYLGALLYGLILLRLLDKFRLRTRAHGFIPVLILLNLILGTYSAVLLGFRAPLLLTRNFLLFGLPFLLLGDWLNRRQFRLQKRHLMVAIVLLSAIVILENMVLRSSFSDFNVDCFAATPVLACAVFLLALQYEDHGKQGIVSLVALLGKRTSTTIYIVHPLVISELDKLISAAGENLPFLNSLYACLGPVVVLAVSTLIGCLLHLAVTWGRKHTKITIETEESH